ncbi:MAG TPA: O-antigen ligase family protein [Gallionella sp.]|nr:O-antigen ligase family protein [Gallionella sp.]
MNANAFEKKSVIGVVIGFLLAVLSMRLMSNAPIPYVLEVEAAGILFLLMFVVVRYLFYPLYCGRFRASGYEKYIFLLMCLPFYSAWRSYVVFGQPLIYGVLCQRYIWLSATALLLINCFRYNWVGLKDIEKSMVVLSWLCLGCYVLVQLFVNPANYAGELQFVARSSVGYLFKFETAPLVFGFFYYLMKWFVRRSHAYFFAVIPFLSMLLFIDKRSLHLSMIMAILLTIWIYFDHRKLASVVFKLFFVVTSILVMVYLANPEYLDKSVTRFNEAVSVVLTAEKGDDDSSNARIGEVLIALPYIQENWMLGNGDVSSQWNGGYESILGYFYTSDIGMIGALFVFGLIGVALVYGQFFFVNIGQLSAVNLSYAPFSLASFAVVLTLFFQSAIKGDIIFSPAQVLFFIVIVNQIASPKLVTMRNGGTKRMR